MFVVKILYLFQDFLPTMCFYNISSGMEHTESSGSFVNEAEAQFVSLLLSVLVSQGLQATAIGVITLYKAQAHRIQNIVRTTK
jgi:superfamily I DNA and/or RNA helicase